MNKLERIRLHSRDNSKNYLEKIPEEENAYLFVTDMPSLRVGGSNSGMIEWIDPSGGPMIKVGEILDEAGRRVKSIKFIKYFGWIITFE